MARPPNRYVKCLFYTPIGVEDVRLNGSEISGSLTEPHDYWTERGLALIQRFANWAQDPKSILRFIESWGPLQDNVFKSAPPCFSFSIESWIRNQAQFRELWVLIQRFQRRKREFPEGVLTLSTLNSVVPEFGPKGFILRCPDLYTFMWLELISNAKALRVCKRTDCPTRYFVAQHGKELYCSTKCANWAQSKWKKRWHEERRKERTQARKIDGAKETRQDVAL